LQFNAKSPDVAPGGFDIAMAAVNVSSHWFNKFAFNKFDWLVPVIAAPPKILAWSVARMSEATCG
jgi:hypothetical protein